MKSLKHYSALILAVMLVLLAGCQTTREGMDLSSQTAGEYVDDSVVTSRVKTALIDEPTLSSAEIEVETFQGKVQLSGFVNSQEDINTAVRVARNVEGVKKIINHMTLKEPKH